MGPIIFDTERLNLRAWTLDDVPGIVELFEDPEVAEFVNDGEPASIDDATKFVRRYMRIQNERGWCRWALELKDDPGRVAGFCGVGCTFAPEIELGWTLRRDLWGRGLATEAARAAFEYCFEQVGFGRVISAIDSDNVRSVAVAERLGMRQDGTIEHEGAQLLRMVLSNPRGSVEPGPGFVTDCDGESRGSSLNSDDPAL